MKILAIRGCNLASIDGEFEVDFRKEPLASAGIFAITGHTGAGKTTILDAMCIALYRETPRLENVNGGPLIDSNIKIGDIRTILRKGKIQGYAEVDFLAVDGKEYRVRWCVARTNKSPTGNFKNAETYITDLATGERRSLAATEHKVLIPKLIGLEYQQFTRSVLLAQGRFAAFLKANDDEKAKMLSALTDTGIYTRISAAIYAKAKKVAEEMTELEAMCIVHKPEDDDKIAAAKEELESLGKELKQKKEDCEVMKAKLEWLIHFAAINEQISLAQKEFAEAKEKLEKEEPKIQKLKLIDSVQPIRDEYTSLRDTKQQHTVDKQQLAQLEKQFVEKELDFEKAKVTVDTAVANQERINTEYIGKQPVIAQAREVEEQYAKDQRVYEELAGDAKRSNAALEKYIAEIAALDRRLTTLTVEQEEKKVWFEKYNHYSAAIQMIPTIVENIKAIEDEKLEVDKKEKSLATARELLATHEEHLTNARDSEEALKQTMSSEIAALRKRLVNGEPCPVCGSRHHEVTEITANLLQEVELEKMKESNRKLIEHLESNISNCRTEIEKLQSAIDLHNSSIARKHNTNLTHLAGIEDAEALLAGKSAAKELNALFTNWNSFKERLQAITSEIEVEKANKAGHLSRIQDIEKELSEKRARIEKLGESIKRDKEQLQALLGNWKTADELQQHYIGAITDANKAFADAAQYKAGIESVRGRLKGQISAKEQQIADAAAKIETLLTRVNGFLALRDDNMDIDMLGTLLQIDHSEISVMRSDIDRLVQTMNEVRAKKNEREQRLAEHSNATIKPGSEETVDNIKETLLLLEKEMDGINSQVTQINARLLEDEKKRKEYEKYSAEHNKKMEQKAQWDALDNLFGSANGDKLTKFAQEYTLDILLCVANEHLAGMTKRYRLARVSEIGMDIKVIDLDMMAESRSANTLSGGETFIVSLALSLALSSLSSNRMKIESLFIDEGFGALDKETLQTALMMLDKLQSSGRKVGVISHLTEMLEQIPVKVNVVRLSPGKSKVEITGKTH